MLGMTTLTPGRYRLRRVGNVENIDYNTKQYVEMPNPNPVEGAQIVLYEVLDPHTHDHDRQMIPGRMHGQESWMCEGCGRSMTREEYEIWLSRSRAKKWLEKAWVAFNDDRLGEQDEIPAVTFYEYLKINFGSL